MPPSPATATQPNTGDGIVCRSSRTILLPISRDPIQGSSVAGEKARRDRWREREAKQPLWKTAWRSLRTSGMELPSDRVYIQNCRWSLTDVCTPVFPAA